MIDNFLQLRILVGYLGEKNQFNWWDTSFLNGTGLKFLEINFPRSAFSAGVHSVTEAAKQLHDKRIGRGRVFHLFRLPSMTEEKLHLELLNVDYARFLVDIETKDSALGCLERLAGKLVDVAEGPVQVGALGTLMSDLAIREMSMQYFCAFTSGKQTFPYFTMD